VSHFILCLVASQDQKGVQWQQSEVLIMDRCKWPN